MKGLTYEEKIREHIAGWMYGSIYDDTCRCGLGG